MWRNELRKLWSRGEAAIGIWTTSGSSLLAEAIAPAGPDYVVIDAQHGFMGPDAIRMCLLALARTSPTPLVRVPTSEPGFIGQMLDAGAHGVIVPMVETPDDARRAVAACRMPPAGQRSFGPIRAAQSFDRDPATLSNEVLCIVMIETAQGVDHVDDIVAVAGVDGVCIGPADLAISYGLSPGLSPTTWTSGHAMTIGSDWRPLFPGCRRVHRRARAADTVQQFRIHRRVPAKFPPHLSSRYCFSTDYPHIEGGTDVKRKFVQMLSPFGDEIVQRYFVKNSALLIPPLEEITGRWPRTAPQPRASSSSSPPPDRLGHRHLRPPRHAGQQHPASLMFHAGGACAMVV
jgi:4-hydroxy-2-oxoheptanedioate aldolase